MGSEGRAPEKRRTNSRFPLHVNDSSQRSVLVMDFLKKNNLKTAGGSCIFSCPGSNCFFLFAPLKLALKGRRFCDASDIMKMRRKSWKGFHKMVSRNVSNTFTVAGRSRYLQKGTILKEMKSKGLYCFAFLRNKVIPGTFWSCHVN
jgi:hypothetical protein